MGGGKRKQATAEAQALTGTPASPASPASPATPARQWTEKVKAWWNQGAELSLLQKAFVDAFTFTKAVFKHRLVYGRCNICDHEVQMKRAMQHLSGITKSGQGTKACTLATKEKRTADEEALFKFAAAQSSLATPTYKATAMMGTSMPGSLSSEAFEMMNGGPPRGAEQLAQRSHLCIQELFERRPRLLRLPTSPRPHRLPPNRQNDHTRPWLTLGTRIAIASSPPLPSL